MDFDFEDDRHDDDECPGCGGSRHPGFTCGSEDPDEGDDAKHLVRAGDREALQV